MIKIATTFFMLLMSASANAYTFPCQTLEAQFIGTISNTRTEKVDQGYYNCYLKVTLHRFNSSTICPLDITSVYNKDIFAGEFRCEDRYKNGSHISGYLILSSLGVVSLDQ